MRESIRGFSDAVVEDCSSADRLSGLADEMEGVSRLVADNPALRLVLADPGLAAHVRRSVVTDLFASQVSDACVRLLVFVIDADRATEFTQNLAWLTRFVAAARDGMHPVHDGPLGRTAATERADGYASAVLEAVTADDGLGDVEDDLFRFSRVVLGSDELTEALTDIRTPLEARRGVVNDLLSSKVTGASTRLAVYAVLVSRPRDYISVLSALVERVAEESQRQVAEVRAATEMTDEQQRRLGAALTRILGHDVDVRVIVDRSVLGGFVASVGDSVVDGSVRHRLEQLRDRLVLPGANVNTR
ncbi:MAG: ATP synthase F1 subunit delta [Actinomycetota bacterium]|nr:ATP synthase F1 subunit delta [Actinomycetota bacterium]